jgi:hypothetical protein
MTAVMSALRSKQTGPATSEDFWEHGTIVRGLGSYAMIPLNLFWKKNNLILPWEFPQNIIPHVMIGSMRSTLYLADFYCFGML